MVYVLVFLTVFFGIKMTDYKMLMYINIAVLEKEYFANEVGRKEKIKMKGLKKKCIWYIAVMVSMIPVLVIIIIMLIGKVSSTSSVIHQYV